MIQSPKRVGHRRYHKQNQIDLGKLFHLQASKYSTSNYWPSQGHLLQPPVQVCQGQLVLLPHQSLLHVRLLHHWHLELELMSELHCNNRIQQDRQSHWFGHLLMPIMDHLLGHKHIQLCLPKSLGHPRSMFA